MTIVKACAKKLCRTVKRQRQSYPEPPEVHQTAEAWRVPFVVFTNKEIGAKTEKCGNRYEKVVDIHRFECEFERNLI